MNGFFEHQYLSYKKNHIKNLLALAKADGFVHAKEQKMLFKILLSKSGNIVIVSKREH